MKLITLKRGTNFRLFTSACILVFAISVFTGCQTQPPHEPGTFLETDADGKWQYVTYLTMEDYQRMTPDEVRRLGPYSIVGLPHPRQPSPTVKELDRATAKQEGK